MHARLYTHLYSSLSVSHTKTHFDCMSTSKRPSERSGFVRQESVRPALNMLSLMEYAQMDKRQQEHVMRNTNGLV